MNKIKFRTLRTALVGTVSLLLVIPLGLTSCKEEIDDSAYSIAEKDQLMQLLEKDPSRFSLIAQIFSEVKLGLLDNASTINSVLAARGNYTLFAPTDEAVRNYVSEVTDGKSTDIADLTAEQKQRIAYNCIIDNGDEGAYELADFPSQNTTFANTNLADRRLQCEQRESGDYYINYDAKVIDSNIEASNGMMFVVDHVILPSYKSVAEQIADAPNLRTFALLLTRTGWDKELALHDDEEEAYQLENVNKLGETKSAVGFDANSCSFMDTRYVKYTVFVERDSVFEKDWGITAPEYDEHTNTYANGDAVMAAIESKCEEILGTTTAHGDYENEDNAVNQFVAYHLINGGMPLDGLTRHMSEYGYAPGSNKAEPQTSTLSVNVWDYYTTMGKHRALLKVTQLGDWSNAPDAKEHNYYVNRISKYNDAFDGDYRELSWTEHTPSNGQNLLISATNTIKTDDGIESITNNCPNGYYYPIDGILINSSDIRNALGNERLRIDVTTMLPEMLSNDLRIKGKVKYFPQGYFSNITREGTSNEIYYLPVRAGGWKWKDYQGDEFIVLGNYDFIIKLPPVPKDGTYEIRMGTSNNQIRSMVQVYFGDSETNLQPCSLPIDQRTLMHTISNTPWKTDESMNYDEATCREADRQLRNLNYMKGPQYFCVTDETTSSTLRNYYDPGSTYFGPGVRYLITQQYMKADKTYYFRMKNVLNNSSNQFFLDYFEIVPSSVYNADTMEDIW